MSRGRFMVTCEHLGSCVSHSVEVLLLSVVVLFVVGGGGGVCLLWGVETFLYSKSCASQTLTAKIYSIE